MGGGGEGVEMEAEQREVVAWAGVAVEVAGGGDAGGGGRGGGGVGGGAAAGSRSLGVKGPSYPPPPPLIFFFTPLQKKLILRSLV